MEMPRITAIAQALVQQTIEGDLPATRYLNKEGELDVSMEELQRLVEAEGGKLIFRKSWGVNDERSMLFSWPQGGLGISGGESTSGKEVDVIACSNDPELFARLERLVEKVLGPSIPSGQIYVLMMGRNGPIMNSIGVAGAKLIEENYVPEAVEGVTHVIEDLKAKDPCGRIVIFDGKVGTGKTHLVRALLNAAPNAKFVMIPASMVPELAGPSLVGCLIDNFDPGQPMVLVIEDADECLVRRDGMNMSAISTLLNLSDGILGASLNIRIVATTNAGHLQSDEQLDDALMRPGRLCRRIHVPELGAEQAAAVYLRLTGTQRAFGGPATVAEVYRIAKDAGFVQKRTVKKMGFGS